MVPFVIIEFSFGIYFTALFLPIAMQPLPTKLILSKKRAKEGKSSDEVEHFPVPSRVTVRRRPTVNAVEMKESEVCCGNIVRLQESFVLDVVL